MKPFVQSIFLFSAAALVAAAPLHAKEASRKLASSNVLDDCYDQAANAEANESCNAVFEVESELARQALSSLHNDPVLNEENAPEKIEEVASRELQLDKRKHAKGMFKKIKEARKQYRDWKKKNPEKAKSYVAAFKELRKKLKDDQAFREEWAEVRKECISGSQEECRARGIQSLNRALGGKSAGIQWDLIPAAYADGPEVQGCSTKNFGFHAVLFGADKLSCSSRDLTRSSYGPGAYVGASALFIACANGFHGINVGVGAGGGAVLGVNSLIAFGGGGVCTSLGVSFSLGGYAGIEVLDFN